MIYFNFWVIFSFKIIYKILIFNHSSVVLQYSIDTIDKNTVRGWKTIKIIHFFLARS